ncbi:hypothetical protein [Gordonia polyisoprenivorans]|uniref:hypothetical protein n=1 Tax=Gordonia polyisoprenivorans TaxID=84595 RepID=UPI001AD61163|nr:hypothetical protein [Gordonia polyisoprenivorans]QTI66871.1 hypothetical protein J6U32_14450 [Gordonia polyisoprenivorans]
MTISTGATGYGVRPRTFEDPPAKSHTQDELRAQRRKFVYRPLRYGADFDLAAEVHAVVGPVADKLTGEPCPASAGYVGAAQAVVEAVAQLCDTTIEMVNDRKVARVGYTDRDRARRALRTLHAVAPPEITRAALIDGSWQTGVVDMAAPLSGPLADLLSRATPSASDTLVESLRALDRAAADLDHRIDKAAFYRSQNPTATTTTADDPEAARRTLADLGIDMEANQ